MARRRSKGPSLFDDEPSPAIGALIETPPTVGPHEHDWEDTETDWGEPWGIRMTKTCRACKLVVGRA